MHLADAVFPMLQPALERDLGMVLTVLRRVSAQFDAAMHQATEVLVMEPHHWEAASPIVVQWVGLDTSQITLARYPQRELIVAHVREVATGEILVLRPPWACLSGYAQAVAWITAEVTRLGYELHPPIIQVRTWSLLSVLRAPTAAGTLYFKVAAALPTNR